MNRLRTATQRRDEAGFSLVELLVVIMLLSVIAGIVSSIIISAMRTSSKQEDQTRTLIAAKVAMERVTREVRGANSLTAAAPRALTMVTVADGVRRVTTIEVVSAGDGTELRQVDQRRVLATGVESTETRTVLGGLAVGSTDAVFTYADGGGTALPPLTTTPLTFDHGNVRTIGIRVLLRRGFGADPIELYQLVSIRNLED